MTKDEHEHTNLNSEDIEYLNEFLRVIEELGENIQEPIDPKVEPLLEVVHRLIVEQLTLDKKYEWREAAEKDDRLLNDQDIPSADDLRKMMGGE